MSDDLTSDPSVVAAAAAAAAAGPSRSHRPPWTAAAHRPTQPDGIFRVLLVSSGSVASIKVPLMVSALQNDPGIEVQVVATKASLHFYDQAQINDSAGRQGSESGSRAPPMSKGKRKREEQGGDGAIRDEEGGKLREEEMIESGCGSGGVGAERVLAMYGAEVWTDEDEWADWRTIGDPILHIELRRWADLVVVAPCSADMLAKIAAGFCDNLALSTLRALPSTTPVILCPAMNTHMYAHPFTSKHLRAAQDELGYLVLGPQGAGTLACGDEGPGKMTDWRDIVVTIQDFAALFRDRTTKSISETTQTSGDLKGKGHKNPSSSANTMGDSLRPSQPPRQSSDPAPSLQTLSYPYQLDRPSNVLNWIAEHDVDSESQSKGGRQNQSQDQNRHGDRKRVKQSRHQGLPVRFGIVGAEGPRAPTEERNGEKTYSAMSVSEKEEYRVRNGDGGDGSVWSRNWWFP